MLEERVTEWANANPEPQPPTWGEWISEISGRSVDEDLLRSPVPDNIIHKFSASGE